MYLGSLVYRREYAIEARALKFDPVGPPQHVLNPYNSKFESASFDGGRFFATQTGNGETYSQHYYFTDHLGSVRVIVDGNTGDVLERNDYYPFGLRTDKADYEIADSLPPVFY